MSDACSVQNRIFEKLRTRTSNDFKNIPESKRTKFDNYAIKLIDSFEFITVPTTKKECGFKTLFINKYTTTQTFIEITKEIEAETDKNVIVFRCGDELLKIFSNSIHENYLGPPISMAAAQDILAYQNIYNPFNRTISSIEEKVEALTTVPSYRPQEIYRIIGNRNKAFPTFDEVESYLIDFVVEYTRNFKPKKPTYYY